MIYIINSRAFQITIILTLELLLTWSMIELALFIYRDSLGITRNVQKLLNTTLFIVWLAITYLLANQFLNIY